MIGCFSQKLQAAENQRTLRSLLFAFSFIVRGTFFFYGSKRDQKARNAIDESMNRGKGIFFMLDFKCSLS